MDSAKPLTNKQAMFVEEYLVDCNAMQAALRAGYAASTAQKQSSSWVPGVGKDRNKCPEDMRHVWDAIVDALEARKAAVKVTAQDLLIDLEEMRQADIADAYDENGNLLDPKDWPAGLRKMMTGLDVHEVIDEESQTLASRSKKPRFIKRTELIALMGKHINVQAFKEQVDHHHTIDLADRIMAARRRGGVPRNYVDVSPEAERTKLLRQNTSAATED